jgi:hypothetical protein
MDFPTDKEHKLNRVLYDFPADKEYKLNRVLYDFPANKRTDVHVLTHQLVIMGTSRPASTQQDPWWGSVWIPLHSACAPEITHIQTQNSAQKTIPIGVNWIVPWQIPLNFQWKFFFRKE